jgi:hypothetical protein
MNEKYLVCVMIWIDGAVVVVRISEDGTKKQYLSSVGEWLDYENTPVALQNVERGLIDPNGWNW